MSTGEGRISLRVKVPAEGGTAIVEMTGPAVPDNGLQAFGDWVLAALEQHADGAAEARAVLSLRSGNGTGRATSWPTSSRRCWEAARCRISALCGWIWMSWPDMDLFIGRVRDPGRAVRLEIAISGRGAFRRFKDVLARWPGELDRWYAFSAERQRGRARAWLADAGYYVRKGLPPS
jgi:hypothetical protein